MPLKPNPLPAIYEALRKAIFMYRDNPYSLFCHTDFTSYMYHRLHACDLEVRIRDVRIQCVHRDYPANFRIKDKDLRSVEVLPEIADEPIDLDNTKAGTRGSFDLVVLRPSFVRLCIEEAHKRSRSRNAGDPRELLHHIINKDLKLVRQRRDLEEPFEGHTLDKEILFAFQLNLVTELTPKTVEDIRRDSLFLSMAAHPPSEISCMNLIFCNVPQDEISEEDEWILKEVLETVASSPTNILTMFVHSWFNPSLQISSHRPLINRSVPLWARELLEKTSHKTA